MSNSGQALCTIRFLNFGRAGVGYDIVQKQLLYYGALGRTEAAKEDEIVESLDSDLSVATLGSSHHSAVSLGGNSFLVNRDS